MRLQQDVTFALITAGLCLIAVCGCRVAGGAKDNTVNQNTSLPAATQTSKLDHLSGKNNSQCPAVVKVVNTGPSKPPFTFSHLELKLINRQPKAIWLLLRHRESFPDTGKFACYGDEKHCFSSIQLSDDSNKQQGKAVVVSFLGLDTFRAIRIPAGGDIFLGHYITNTKGAVTDFEVWEVDSLQVNGKTPLEDWLPYPVMSDRVVHIGEQQKQTDPDLDKNTNKKRQDYPNEKVEFVTAHAIRKWLVPVDQSQSNRHK